MYWINRSMPARSPAGRYTNWSTLNPLCGHVRMFSTASGPIFFSVTYRSNTASRQATLAHRPPPVTRLGRPHRRVQMRHACTLWSHRRMARRFTEHVLPFHVLSRLLAFGERRSASVCVFAVAVRSGLVDPRLDALQWRRVAAGTGTFERRSCGDPG